MPQVPEEPPIEEEAVDTGQEEELFEPLGGETIMSEPVNLPPPPPAYESVPPPTGEPAYTPPPLGDTPVLPPQPPVEAKSNKTTWIIIVVVAVVLLFCCCCIIAIAAFLMSESGTEMLEEMGLVALPFLNAAV